MDSDEMAELNILGGTYQLDKKIILDKQDSHLHLKAFQNDDDVLISGGESIHVEDLKEGEIQTTLVPGKCGEVFLDNIRLMPARSPNVAQVGVSTAKALGPYYKVTDLLVSTSTCSMHPHSFKQSCPYEDRLGFVFNDEFNFDWENVDSMEVLVFHSWVAEVAKVKNITHSNGRNEVYFKAPLKHYPVGTFPSFSGFRFILFNHASMLDMPGEYMCDQIDDYMVKISFIPPEGVTSGNLVVSQLGTLLEMNSATDVKLTGVRFQHTSSRGTVDGWQNGRYTSIKVQSSRDIHFDQCEFSHLAVIGITVGTTVGFTIERSNLYDIGGHGIFTSFGNNKYEMNDIMVQNNQFHGCGMTNFWQPVCIWAGAKRNLTIRHNDFAGPAPGIRIKGLAPLGKHYWADRNITTPTREDYNIHIEYNHVHDYGAGILNDFGGIYLTALPNCDGLSKEDNEAKCYTYIHVYNNLVANANSYKGSSGFLYSDCSISRVTYENNVMYGDVDMAVKNHCGLDNWAFNNYLYSTARQIDPHRSHIIISACGSPDRVWNYENHHNIYYIHNSTGVNVFKPSVNQVSDLHDNIYWSPNPSTIDNLKFWRNMNWKQHQAAGYDVNSQWVDPMFTDPDGHNFQLRDDSPAFNMGIKQIDLSAIGVQEELKYH